MSGWRKIRAMLGIGVAWGVVLGAAMTLVAAAVWLVARGLHAPIIEEAFLPFVLIKTVFGMAVGIVAGFVFAATVAITQRDRTVSTLSAARLAGWGAFTAFLLLVPSLLLFANGLGASIAGTVALVVAVGGMGMVMAATTLRAAREAEPLPGNDSPRLVDGNAANLIG